MEFKEQDLIRLWGNGEPILIKGKEFAVKKMSYGQYFLEPFNSCLGENDGFHKDTIWLKKIEDDRSMYCIEEDLFKGVIQ